MQASVLVSRDDRGRVTVAAESTPGRSLDQITALGLLTYGIMALTTPGIVKQLVEPPKKGKSRARAA